MTKWMVVMLSESAPDQIRAAISKAVDLHGERVRRFERVPFGNDAIRIPPWIAGRIVREGIALDEADELSRALSQSIAENLGVEGLVPATIKIDKDILVGFIDRFTFEKSITGLQG